MDTQHMLILKIIINNLDTPATIRLRLRDE